jgi:hypothetical protein
MAMNRSQMFKQVRGYATGGAPGTGGISGLSDILGLTPAQSILSGATQMFSGVSPGLSQAMAAPAPATQQPPGGFNLPSAFDPAGAEILPGTMGPLLGALTPPPRAQASPGMARGVAPTGGMSGYDELIAQARKEADTPLGDRREKYLRELQEIMGPRQGSMDIYDLAGTVGRAMLSADPRTGAFRSIGAGLSDFSQRVKELEAQQRQQDRQIALKAYEMARTDEQAAKNLVRDYMLLKAKETPAGKLTAYKVTNPAGMTIGGRHYDAGEEVFLDEYEARAVRTSIGSATGNTAWKSPEAALTAVWQDADTARSIIKSLGMSEDNPNFERAVAQITARDPAMIGKPIIMGGAYTELRPLVKGDEVFNVVMGSSDAAGTPFMTVFTEQRLKDLAKGRTDIMAASQTVQRVRSAREQLRTDSNLITGMTQSALLPFRKAVASAFGLRDEELVGLESLEAVLNYLGPRMRVAGSGPTSDRDMKIQMSSIGTLANTPQANYISLYAFERMTENAQRLAQLEEEALTSGQFSSTAELNRFLAENDPGLFERFDGDVNDDAAIQAWYDSLPEGAVIDNTQRLIVDADGNPVPSPFIIKGWVARK